MKIVIYTVPVILAALLMTGLFDARNDAPRPAAATPQPESPGEHSTPAPEWETGDPSTGAGVETGSSRVPLETPQEGANSVSIPVRPTGLIQSGPENRSDQQGPTLAAEPQQEQPRALQRQDLAAEGEWQVIRQRPRELVRAAPQRQPTVDLEQLARDQEAEQEQLLQQQAQQLERLVELQRRQFEDLLEQQDRRRAEVLAQRRSEESPRQTETQRVDLVEQQPLLQDRDGQQLSGYDNRPLADPYADDALEQGELDGPPLEPVPDDRRRYERDRSIRIPLPGGRRLRFGLW